MAIEQDELGARPERMVELYAIACTIYDDVSLPFSLSLSLSTSQLCMAEKTLHLDDCQEV